LFPRKGFWGGGGGGGVGGKMPEWALGPATFAPQTQSVGLHMPPTPAFPLPLFPWLTPARLTRIPLQAAARALRSWAGRGPGPLPAAEKRAPPLFSRQECGCLAEPSTDRLSGFSTFPRGHPLVLKTVREKPAPTLRRAGFFRVFGCAAGSEIPPLVPTARKQNPAGLGPWGGSNGLRWGGGGRPGP